MSILLQLQCTEDDFCQTKKNHTTSNGIVLKWESGGGGRESDKKGDKDGKKIEFSWPNRKFIMAILK